MLPEIGQRVEFLQNVQIFNELNDQDLAVIADRLKLVAYPAGTAIFSAGEDGDNLYFLLSGIVCISQTDEDSVAQSERLVIDVGDTFGEDALYFKRERWETATATNDVQLYYINEDEFEWVRDTFPQVEPYLAVFTRTHEISSRLKITWLGQGEHINLITRRHPIRLFGEAIGILFSIALVITVLLGLTYFIKGLEDFISILWYIGLGYTILGFVAILWAVMEWRNDYFIVTNVRVVWRERILFRGTSRQETPLRTIQSLNIQTGSFIARALKVGDLIVRTFNSELRMTDVRAPEQMRDLIHGFILRSRNRSQRDLLDEIRRTIRQRLNIESGETQSEESEPLPPLVTKKYGRFALFKTRTVENGTITYHKHWTIFFRNAILPNILFIISLFSFLFLSVYFVFSEFAGRVLILGGLLFITFFSFLWWLYEYEDWRNDLYRVTKDLIIDRDKKPFGKESFRSAPIKNIQSLGHKVPNIFVLIFNVGNVDINVGD